MARDTGRGEDVQSLSSLLSCDRPSDNASKTRRFLQGDEPAGKRNYYLFDTVRHAFKMVFNRSFFFSFFFCFFARV